MATAKSRQAGTMPWRKYRKKHGKLMEPGWAGDLNDAEMEALQTALLQDRGLAYWWGFRPGAKRRTPKAIQAVALHGSPENRGLNVKLTGRASKNA